METRVIVSAVICDGDKILLGKKAKGRPPYPDVWHTMGGGVFDLEKGLGLVEQGKFDDVYFHQELQREIREEAHAEIENIQSIYPKYRDKPREAVTKNKDGIDTQYIFLEYICDFVGKEVSPGDDIVELLWIEKNKLNSINLTPPSAAMYRELGWIN